MRSRLPHITKGSLPSLRMRAGLTQKELGSILGVQQCKISHWETGRRKIPTLARFALFSILGSFDEEDYVETFRSDHR